MPDNNSDTFKDFLLYEYSNIAQAHFKSIETISTFFRYYLLIMSIPISAVVVIFRFTQDRNTLINIVQQYKVPIGPVLFCISAIGFGVFLYIVSLRLDVIFYARVVNGIRKFFYDESDVDINLKIRMRALPQSPQLPSYWETYYFIPVVFVFGLMNSLYFFFAMKILLNNYLYPIIYTPIFLFSHLVFYWAYTRHREIKYLKSNILGVDIDGVLNKHREKFCSLLYEKTEKEIKPEEITIIPVHEHPTLGITREDERKVFNDPKYWTDMEVIEDAEDNLRKLRNIFRLKIYIFTYRPSPDNPDKEELLEDIKKFLQSCKCFSLKDILLKVMLHIPLLKKLSHHFKEQPLIKISKEWLKKHKIKYDKFIFEKGNDYSSEPRGKFRNRFYISRKKKIKYFVEDDIEKAIKLSYICDVVFLISHPYNEPNDELPQDIKKLRENLHSNIIHVNTWTEIYQQIRRLS